MKPTRHSPAAEHVFDASPDALVVTDETGTVLLVNDRALELLRARRGEVVGQPIKAVLTNLSGKGPWTTGLRRSDGATVPVEATRSSGTSGGHAFTVFSLRDLGERRQRTAKVEFLSTHDALTGLANRASFDEALELLEEDGPWPVGVLMLDVDGLKAVNDVHGHVAGDELLRQTAAVLRQTFRDSDLVARIGGDEFAVLTPAPDGLVIDRFAQRLESARVKHNRDRAQPLSFSVGTAVAHQGQSMRDALQLADARMYEVKQRHHALTPR